MEHLIIIMPSFLRRMAILRYEACHRIVETKLSVEFEEFCFWISFRKRFSHLAKKLLKLLSQL